MDGDFYQIASTYYEFLVSYQDGLHIGILNQYKSFCQESIKSGRRPFLASKPPADKKAQHQARPPKERDILKKMQALHGAGKLRIHPHANQRMDKL